MSDLAQRLAAVIQRIHHAANEANRNASELTLIVVSKFHPAQMVLDLIDLGVTDFGENKDQEAAPKAAEVAAALQAVGAEIGHRWHFVGQLQSNKVKSVLRYASAIHSLDRPSLLSALDKETQKLNAARLELGESAATPIDVFIELNLTGDPERGGYIIPH